MVYVDNYYANLAKRVNTQLESQESLKKTFEPPKEKKMSLSKLEERLKLGDQAFFKAIYSDLDKEVQSYNVAFKASKLRSLLHGHDLDGYPNVRDQMEGLLLSMEGVARHLEDRKFDSRFCDYLFFCLMLPTILCRRGKVREFHKKRLD